jgi:hypothetical protein
MYENSACSLLTDIPPQEISPQENLYRLSHESQTRIYLKLQNLAALMKLSILGKLFVFRYDSYFPVKREIGKCGLSNNLNVKDWNS